MLDLLKSLLSLTEVMLTELNKRVIQYGVFIISLLVIISGGSVLIYFVLTNKQGEIFLKQLLLYKHFDNFIVHNQIHYYLGRHNSIH